MTDKAQSVIETVRVEQLACIECQHVMDVSHLPSFSPIKCPACGSQQTVPAKFGSFLLLSRLGFGGMGVVFHGVDRELGRHVAIKVMKRSLGENAEFVRSFRHEAQAAATLNHRNVVQIYSFGQVEGQPYIVMELVDGGCLDKMIAGGPLAETRTLAIHLEVTEGLTAASQVGLVHGDIKPANILFGKNGEAKVLDFGLASFIGQQTQQGGQVWGTPYYIAPEKVRGKKIDFRSDIYSLGATIFHVLTGQPPFEGATPMDVVMARLKQPAPNLQTLRADIHPQTAAMVARMMEADPTMRYPSYPALMVDMRDALAASQAPLKKSAPKSVILTAGIAKPFKLMKRASWIKAGIAAAAILIILAVTWGVRAHLQKVEAAAALEERSRLRVVVERGGESRERLEAIALNIISNAASLQSLAQKTDQLALSIPETEPAMIELREAVECVQTVTDEVELDRGLAGSAVQLLAAVTNTQAAQAQVARLESLFDKMIVNYNLIEEVKKSSSKALAAAGEFQRRAQEVKTLAQQKVADAEVAAAARKQKEEEDRQLALARAKEAERMRPIITQRELDLLDEALASNAPFILHRKFDEAAKAVARLQPDLTMDESKAYCLALVDAYQGMEKMKAFIMKSIRAKPCPNGWVAGDTSRDIVDVDADRGIMVALGADGKMLVPWEKIGLQQLLKIAQYYLNAPGVSDKEQAQVLLGMALFCQQSGEFKTAENCMAAAYRQDSSLKDEINRLLPGLLAGP